MVEIKEVITNKQKRDFILFPIKLYKGNEYFVPELYGDVKKLLNKNHPNHQIAKSVFYLAYVDNKVVGRIQGIIQFQSNEKNNEKKARFTRVDFIEDIEVARALFKAIEDWALSNGMKAVVGPLGYNDLEREGLLIDGFDELSTFEEEYNYPYYPKFLDELGYKKDVDWFEFALKLPDKVDPRLEEVTQFSLDMCKLHIAKKDNLSNKEYIAKYRDGFFYVLDEAYSKLYGTVPISKDSQDELIKQFLTILDKRFLLFVCDEKENVVAFALCFPSLSKAVRGTSGRLTPRVIYRILKAVKHPDVVDLGLVGILPQYRNKGVNAVVITGLMNILKEGNLDHAETNLNLEYNHQVMSQWKYFNSRNHKMRRSYIKELGE